MKKRKLSKGSIATIAVAAAALIAALSLVVVNIFVPVKYLTAFITFSKDGRQDGTARLRFLNVGYGDCFLAEFPDGKTLLVDGGNGSYANNKRLLATLNKSGVDKIDYLVCTSVKPEHCGGLAEILRYKTVETVYSPYCRATYITDAYHNFYTRAKRSGAAIKYCEYGEGVNNAEYGYAFYFLKPSAHTIEDEYSEYYLMNSDPTIKNINNASAVIWIECGGVRLLFAGDLQEDALEKLYNEHELEGGIVLGDKKITLSACDILLTPGHGSGFSVYTPLIELISPEAAILSVGENGYGFPDIKSITTVQQTVGDNYYRTDRDGDITITVSNGEYRISKEKL